MKDIHKILIVLGFIVCAMFFLISVSGILAPFIASIILTYFLNPLTKNIEKLGLRRKWTVSIIVGLFFFVFIVCLLKIVPILFLQIQEFVQAIPSYEEYVSQNIMPRVTEFLDNIDADLASRLQEQLKGFSNKFFEYLLKMISSIFDSGIAILNTFVFVLLTPILVFYLLRDWPLFVKSIRGLFPAMYKKNIVDLLKQIDKVLSAYLRGQINVCLLLSLFYTVSLSIIGLNYALLIGIVIGILTIIPYVGVIIGFSLCSVVAALQFSDWFHVGATMFVFVFGHLLESYIITPKLIGEKIGLHPVWIIFALMAGGMLFGFWGMFLAIPIAAVVGVILRSLLQLYQSNFVVEKK